MVPQWLNPKTYLNTDIRVITNESLIVKNVDPFNQRVYASGVDLYFYRIWDREDRNSEIVIKASINGEPFNSVDETNQFTLIELTKRTDDETKNLFQFLMKQGRIQEDQYRKNCHIKILQILDVPDSAAAKAELQLTPRELHHDQ